MKIICVCSVCGKEFKRYKCQIKSVNQFCSSECSYKARSLGLVGRVVSKPYDCFRKPIRNCLICNTEYIYIKKSQKYCSRECFEIAHRDNMLGSKNPAYIDGRSKNKRCYRGDDWEKIRFEVYKRDNFKCQLCGKHCKKKEIQAHHIIPYKLTQNNSLDNLITLCNVCHVKVEYNSEILENKNDRNK